MTQTAEPRIIEMPDEVHTAAVDLVRDLAAVAGDPPAIYDRLRKVRSGTDTENALGALAAALIVTFTECITHPANPGEYVEIDLLQEGEEFDDE